MKKISFLVLSCIFLIEAGCANEQLNETHKLILSGDSGILYAYAKNKYQNIKQADYFYGYGWLDASRVFVAYQPKGEVEAFAVLEIIDINTLSNTKLFETGAGHFDINSHNGNIVFNDEKGVQLLMINLKDYSYKVVPVKTVDSIVAADFGDGVFWIDDKTIGYFDYDNDKNHLVKISIKPDK